MSDASPSGPMSPGLLKVAERAKAYPSSRLLALAHHIDEAALARAHGRIRKDAAVGEDGVTVKEYGQRLEENARALVERMKAGKYRHQPIRRVHIPKEGNKTRPIGISTVEDKIVQGALREVMEAVYEQDFLPCSYGFRPRRSAHDAIRALNRELRPGAVSHVLEADIVSFFDSIDRKMLMEMLRERIADEFLLTTFRWTLEKLTVELVEPRYLPLRSIRSPTSGRPKGRSCHRFLETSICTTFWTSGSRRK